MSLALILALTPFTTMHGLASVSASPTSDLPPCSFEGDAVLVSRKAALPVDALSEIERLFESIGGIADATEFFESTDVQTGRAPSARFIRAYHVGDIWFVWFERGGVGLTKHTVALVPTTEGREGKQVLRVAPGSNFVADLCAGSKAFIAGARSAG